MYQLQGRKSITARSLVLTLVLLPILLFCCVSTATAEAVNVKKLKKAKWTRVVTENFDIVSDARKRDVERITQQLERYRAFCILLLQLDVQPSQYRVKIVLSRNAGSWKKLGLPKSYVSLYRSRDGVPTYIYANIEGYTGAGLAIGNSGRAKIFNSVTQNIFNSLSGESERPLWFKTGFSYYLSSYSERRGNAVLGQLDAIKPRLNSIYGAGGGMVPFDAKSLLSKRNLDFKGVTSRRNLRLVNRYYVQSFILVHYFFADRERRKNMARYLSEVSSGKEIEEALQTTFGVSATQLDTDLMAYAKSNKMMAGVFDLAKIEPRLRVSKEFEVSQIPGESFLKRHARAIIEFDETVISNADKQTFLNTVNAINEE